MTKEQLKFVSSDKLLNRTIEILKARRLGPVTLKRRDTGLLEQRPDNEIYGDIAAAIQLLADRDYYGRENVRYQYETMSDIENHKYKRIEIL